MNAASPVDTPLFCETAAASMDQVESRLLRLRPTGSLTLAQFIAATKALRMLEKVFGEIPCAAGLRLSAERSAGTSSLRLMGKKPFISHTLLMAEIISRRRTLW